MKKLEKRDLYDLLYGCTILGTGGGGKLNDGLTLIDKALEADKTFKLVSMDEVPEKAYISTPYNCGSLTPEKEKGEEESFGTEEPALQAYSALEEYYEEDFYGVLSTELGGANTAVALYTAAMLDKYIIDGDPAGRSVPELQHSTYYLNNIEIAPLAVANKFGDVGILTKVANDQRAEVLVRAMAIASENTIGVADHPMQGKELSGSVIKDALSYALNIGKEYRYALNNGEDAALKVAETGNGRILFRGKVEEYDWKEENGFTVGNIYLKGISEDRDSNYKIWFKNENIISWKNNKVDVTVPDLICVLSEDRKVPVTNPEFKKGEVVSVIALPSPAEWRTEKGLEVFGPRHFGYDIEYTPLNEKE